MKKLILLIALTASGCATTNTKELEARIDKLEGVAALLIKAHDETSVVVSGNAKITNEQSEIVNNNADMLKGAIEILKLHDSDIEMLKKQAYETHF